MFKKIFATIILCTLTSLTKAETCPDISEIKKHFLHGWEAYTLENGTPLTKKAMGEFTLSVHQFSLAEWMDDAPEGSGHCYYEGTTPNQSYLGVFLAKKELIPNQKQYPWETKSRDVMHCIISINDCVFMEK